MKKLDHRVQVAANRREQMRARLMQAAILVFGQRGVEASVIDEVTSTAGVARSTFYNYFRTNEMLLKTVAIEAGDEIMAAIDPIVRRAVDPAERVSTGVRSWLSVVEGQPHFAAFLRRAGLYVLEHNSLVREHLPRDLVEGIRLRRFTVQRPEVAFDLVAGAVLGAINSLAVRQVPEGYAGDLSQGILMALGIEANEARAISNKPIGEIVLPDDSLVVQAGVRLRQLSVRSASNA